MGGAVLIDGRGAQGLGDPPVQNWDSAIALTIMRCTFFANFCGFWGGALAVMGVWPLTSVVRETDYLQNQATVVSQDVHFWNTIYSVRMNRRLLSCPANRFCSAGSIVPRPRRRVLSCRH